MNANVLIAKKWHIPFFSERRATRENFRLSFTQTYVLLVVLFAVLMGYYAFLTNQNATKGFSIINLQAENRELAFKENLLDIRIAEGKSIDVIMNSAIISSMQNVANPWFLVVKDTQFTMN